MHSGAAFKWYNLACSFLCKIYSHHEDNICQLHCSLYVTQFNDIRKYSLFTRGGYKYDTGTNPAQSDGDGGVYKIPHIMLRVVTKSILLVFCMDCLFLKIATTLHISVIYMQFHFYLSAYFSTISIIMCPNPPPPIFFFFLNNYFTSPN